MKEKPLKLAKTFLSKNNAPEAEWYDRLLVRCSTLGKLIRCIAYVMRAAMFLSAKPILQNGGAVSVGGEPHKVRLKNNLVNTDVVREISASEYDDAWKVIIYLEQKIRLSEKEVIRLVPRKVRIQLLNHDSEIEHVVLGSRISNFPESFSNKDKIPILPYGPLSKLVVAHYHEKFHKEVDTIVAHVRRDVWVVKARKIATSIDKRCRICLERRKRWAGQMMGELPSYRSNIMPAWSAVNMDLFGPLTIRDDCVKKGPRVFKKVYGVLYACTRTRGV